jgi:hypothetical protein
MTPRQSEKALTKRLTAGGRKLDQLTAAEGVAAMLEFYAEQRADRCNVDEDGDMLLYQWGVYDFDNGDSFMFDITRQFILLDEDEPYQLSLVFHFEPTPQRRGIESGNQWCHLPADLGQFRKFVLNSPPYRAVAAERPTKVQLYFNQC